MRVSRRGHYKVIRTAGYTVVIEARTRRHRKASPTVSNVHPTSHRITVEGRPAAVELTGQLLPVGATPRNSRNGARNLNKLCYYCCSLECRVPNQLIMFSQISRPSNYECIIITLLQQRMNV